MMQIKFNRFELTLPTFTKKVVKSFNQYYSPYRTPLLYFTNNLKKNIYGFPLKSSFNFNFIYFTSIIYLYVSETRRI